MPSRSFTVYENDAGDILIDSETNWFQVEEGWSLTVEDDAALDELIRVQREWREQQAFLYTLRNLTGVQNAKHDNESVLFVPLSDEDQISWREAEERDRTGEL